MFVIDEDGGISWCVDWIIAEGPVQSAGFDSLRQLTALAEHRHWSKADVTNIWNSFAGTAGFDDLRPAKMFRNRPYGLQKIWDAILRLVPKDATSKPAALAKAIVEDMPKKKAKAKKARKAEVLEVEAKHGSNLEMLIAMLKSRRGASVEEVMAKTGWSATHTVRGRISILKSKGLLIEKTKHETRGTVYRAA